MAEDINDFFKRFFLAGGTFRRLPGDILKQWLQWLRLPTEKPKLANNDCD